MGDSYPVLAGRSWGKGMVDARGMRAAFGTSYFGGMGGIGGKGMRAGGLCVGMGGIG